MLYKGDRLGEEEQASLVEVQRRLRTVALALVSFHQVMALPHPGAGGALLRQALRGRPPRGP